MGKATIMQANRVMRYAYGVLDHREPSPIFFVSKTACRKCGGVRNKIRLTKLQNVYFYECVCGNKGPMADTIPLAKGLWNKEQKEGKNARKTDHH